jgi:hypothetical protein
VGVQTTEAEGFNQYVLRLARSGTVVPKAFLPYENKFRRNKIVGVPEDKKVFYTSRAKGTPEPRHCSRRPISHYEHSLGNQRTYGSARTSLGLWPMSRKALPNETFIWKAHATTSEVSSKIISYIINKAN